jgi:DNA-binding response OmpR family regulator
MVTRAVRCSSAPFVIGVTVDTRILIVDSDKWLARRLSFGLFQAGCQVFLAHDAECAARVALRERPNVILLEVELPRYSGLEFHENLQFSCRGRNIPVIYITGSDNPVLRRAADKLGAKAFLKKPVDMHTVLAAVRDAIGADPQAWSEGGITVAR